MLHRRRPIRRVTHDSLDTAYFFFSFESDLPETAPRHLSGGPQKWSGQASQKSLATPVFMGQNESCLLLKVPPCDDTNRAKIGRLSSVIGTFRAPAKCRAGSNEFGTGPGEKH